MTANGLDKLGNSLKKLGNAPQQIGKAWDEWLGLITWPPGRPFKPAASFSGEWGRFVRVLTMSVAITAAVLGANTVFVSNSFALPKVPLPLILRVVAGFAFASLFYSLYSRLFGLHIRPRQAFFCLSLILIPFLPLFVVLKLFVPFLHVVFLDLAANALAIYMICMLAEAIHITTESKRWKSLSSVLVGVFVIPVFVFL